MSQNPLEFSLNFEIDGTNLYLKLARETKNYLGKHLFYALAKQEVEHAQRFDEIYRSVVVDKNIKEFPFSAKKTAEIEAELKVFFENAGKVSLKENASDLSGYKVAMEMEKTGIKAYKDFLKESAGEMEKYFFMQLIEEEKKHLQALQNVYFYLTGTGDWFEKNESEIWNWMNI